MRIVIPVVSLERGGGTRFLHEVGSRLSDYGHAVTFVHPAGNRLEFPVRASVLSVPYLAPETLPPADVILPNFYLTVPASLNGRGMPVRLCLGYEPFFVDQPAAAAQTYQLQMPIITISGWLRDILRERVGRRSVVVNPGIDPAVFRPGEAERQPLLVACVGRAPEQGYGFKGLHQFLDAMELVKQRYPGVQTLVASPDLQRLEASFPARLVQMPDDPALARFYRQACLFVFPSLLEGFGLPPLEAMACGTPVVTTACGGVLDYARAEENCLMVTPGDVPGLAEAILRLLGDLRLRGRLSQAGVETARPWTWVRTVDQVEHCLKQVLQGGIAV